jgi:hypothetical protein
LSETSKNNNIEDNSNRYKYILIAGIGLITITLIYLYGYDTYLLLADYYGTANIPDAIPSPTSTGSTTPTGDAMSDSEYYFALPEELEARLEALKNN